MESIRKAIVLFLSPLFLSYLLPAKNGKEERRRRIRRGVYTQSTQLTQEEKDTFLSFSCIALGIVILSLMLMFNIHI